MSPMRFPCTSPNLPMPMPNGYSSYKKNYRKKQRKKKKYRLFPCLRLVLHAFMSTGEIELLILFILKKNRHLRPTSSTK